MRDTGADSEQFRVFVESVRDYAMLMLDPSGIVLTWNSGAEEIKGYKAEEIIGQNFSRFYSTEDIASGKPEYELRQAVAHGHFEDEGWQIRKDGSRFFAHIVTTALFSDEGELRGFGKVIRDLTESRAVEAKFAGLLDASPDAIVGVNPAGAITLVNRQAEKLFGYSHDELVGQPVEILIPHRFRNIHTHHRDNYFSQPKTRALGAGLELVGVRKDGEEFPVDISLSSVETPDGLIATAAIRDISDQVSARKRAALEARGEQVKRLEALGQLAGGVAHDFNNLLAIILNYAGFIAEEADDATAVRSDIEEILTAARRAAALTHQLLIFGRRDVVHAEILDINSVLLDNQKLLRSAVGEHIDLRVRTSPNIAMVKADSSQIEQVLLNLAINSRDAMKAGGTLIIETSQRVVSADDLGHIQLEPGRYVCISVSDTGIGVSEEAKRRAFEPFFTTKPKGEGTGLGLATVYGIATAAGGGVTLYSEVGVGTTVKVYIPVTEEPAPAITNPAAARRSAAGQTILLVEDEPQVRELTQRILERNGYHVLVAEKSSDVLPLLAENVVDLLLSDVVMPGISGPQLAELAREKLPNLKVLFMSGHPQDIWAHGDVNESISLLEKPFGTEELLGRVADMFID